jgi:flagellar M-ring protein FliF
MDQAKKLLGALTPRQLASIVIAAIAVVGLVMGLSRWQREAGLKPLYTGLAPEDASAIVQKLREAGVDFKISSSGTEIMAPEDKVPELRLQMAGSGLPKTGRIGFEIFDKTNFGITDFAEHVNYRRALEGELERSIMAISDVQQARVHVTLPKDSVFSDAREAAKASVLVGLRPGTRLASANVVAITNLVSSAVEGLAPESVSVVDMSGTLLSRPRRDGLPDTAQASEAVLEYRQAIEHDLAAKINNTLEPLLGADKFRTGVSADIDMTSGEQSEETFDPAKSVMLSSQKTEDSSGVTRALPSAPGTAANLAPQQAAGTSAQQQPPAATQPAQPGQQNTTPTQTAQQNTTRTGGNSSSTSRRSESITYQSSRITKHLKLPQGSIKRLSIAVLVDQGFKMEGQGAQAHRVTLPPDTEKLKAIQTLVGTLVGLDMTRGDQLTVEALPFDNSVNMDPGSLGAPGAQKKPDEVFSIEALKKKPALLWGSVGGGALVIGLVAFAMTRGKNRGAHAEAQQALPMADAYTGLPAAPAQNATALSSPSHLPALMPSRTEVLLTQLQENSRNNPEAWAGILRGWLSEEEPS